MFFNENSPECWTHFSQGVRHCHSMVDQTSGTYMVSLDAQLENKNNIKNMFKTWTFPPPLYLWYINRWGGGMTGCRK